MSDKALIIIVLAVFTLIVSSVSLITGAVVAAKLGDGDYFNGGLVITAIAVIANAVAAYNIFIH